MAQGRDAHHYVFLDLLLAGVQVVEHDRVEGLQEHLLVAEILALFLLEELVGKLPKGVNSVDDHVKILVGSYPSEVLAERPPDTLPLKPYSIHVQRGHLDKFLQAELLWAVFIGQLVSGDSTKVLDEVNDGVRIQSLALQEDRLDLVRIDLLCNDR